MISCTLFHVLYCSSLVTLQVMLLWCTVSNDYSVLIIQSKILFNQWQFYYFSVTFIVIIIIYYYVNRTKVYQK